MKTKTIIFFILGLVIWLLLTNYQTVYSKMANIFDPSSNQTEVVLNNSTSSINSDTSITNVNTDSEEKATSSSESTIQDVLKNIDESVAANTSMSELEIQKPDSNNAVETDIETKSVSDQAPQTNSYNRSNIAAMHNMWMPFMQPNMAHNMINPSMYMNPMAMMTPMMMSMMGPMMNPQMMMNPMAFMNHPINVMTQAQNMDAMMKGMDPKMMFGMFGQPSQAYLDGEVPNQLPVIKIPGLPTQNYEAWPKNTVSPNISREAKHNAFQTVMAMSPLSMRNMVSMMADKIPVEEGVSWDDAVEAMKLRANEVNFKFVGSSPLWKQIEAETEQPSAKVEMFRFCDARMARKILDEVPEFIVFLPCKIALLEDAEGKLWVMTLDWDVSWLDYAQNPNNHLSKDIREHAKLIRENIQYIMEGAATGDF